MLKEWRGVTLLAIVSALFVAGCGSGSGGTGGMTESGTTPRTRAEKLAPPEKKPTHRRGPILAGEVRPVVDGSGEEAWAAGRSIYLTADGGRTWRAAAPVELHGFVGSELVDPAHGWVVAATSSRNPPPPRHLRDDRRWLHLAPGHGEWVASALDRRIERGEVAVDAPQAFPQPCRLGLDEAAGQSASAGAHTRSLRSAIAFVASAISRR